ncbi:MAG: carboxypeptidase regulatory-like domain-containing protein [Gemmatimonadaceae bacterium]|nr:carboxypeptidase regulatory-like domain-containing protein [Gemmatimonadaceae bacterium]
MTLIDLRTAALRSLASVGAIGCLVLSACSQNSPQPIICTALFAYGITVTVVDSVTGAPAASGAVLVARDGAYTDSVPAQADSPNTSSVAAAGERAGTYTVTISKPGYKPWTQSGVTVTKDECHVRGVALTAKLQR